MPPYRCPRGRVTWAYGVTTVPQRRKTHLPQTLASLRNAGFDKPRLFVDGAADASSWKEEFALEAVARGTEGNIRTFGNWMLALWELRIREPWADFYAIFQDDIVISANAKKYIEQNPFPDYGYANLYTVPHNQDLCQKGHTGWFKSNQLGKGALALVFWHDSVLKLLSSDHMADRPGDAVRGHRSVDGGVVDSLRKKGVSEYCHSPSIVQHLGMESTMETTPRRVAETFRGEGFDLLSLKLPTGKTV